MQKYNVDVVIIGGGLAGILTSKKITNQTSSYLLVDASPQPDVNDIGGFAAFSGAKFSLPPAGLGLLNALNGDTDLLNQKLSEVLSILDLPANSLSSSIDKNAEMTVQGLLREYKSFILTPHEIIGLISRLSNDLEKEQKIIKGKCNGLFNKDGLWHLEVESRIGPVCISAKTVFYAGGRLGNTLLNKAGAKVTDGKGLDVGIRIESLDKAALIGLRNLGPDAKIINGDCRTFCLNVPGEIYRYKYDELLIPGGVVAENDVLAGNVGLLVRVSNKVEKLSEIKESSRKYDYISISNKTLRGLPNRYLEEHTAKILGDDVVSSLTDFCSLLDNKSLIDWNIPYKIHVPLLDWHWDSYATHNSHKTTLDNVYVVGDSSGHARGLLQAALSGWIGAEEYLSEKNK